jgi:glyoxylate reductase
VRGKDGILSLLTDTMDGEVMDSAGKSLKIIANYAVGFNNIDVAAATKRKIAVSNTPGVLTDTTADLAMALILAVARRIVESDVYARAEKYMGWDPLLFMGSDVHHKTLGILGFGRVGQVLAKRAAGFDMKILYHNRTRVDPEIKRNAKKILSTLHISMSEAISLYLTQITLNKGIPFEIKIPNNLTAKTLKDSENGKELHKVSDVDELFQELNS